MGLLEEEVNKELDGPESSFGAQRRVYKFLIDDLNRDNSALIKELQTSKKDIVNRIDEINTEMEAMRSDLSSVNEENKQLHELVQFLGNQISGRRSTNESILSSSISEEKCFNTSQSLDKMIEEVMNSSTVKSPQSFPPCNNKTPS